MLQFVKDYEVQVERDGDYIIISVVLNLEEGIHSMRYVTTHEDIRDFILCNESDIIANDDSVYISFCRNHVIIKEEHETESVEYAIDDSTKFFNTITSWWHNR